MVEDSDNDRFVERLREVREALEEGELETALEGLLEVRESGLVSSGLDAHIDALRGTPGTEAVAAVHTWLERRISSEGQGGGASSSSTEQAGATRDLEAGEIAYEELIAVSEPSEAELLIDEGPHRKSSEDGGEEGLEEPSGSDRTRAMSSGETGFSRESRSLTAVGHESLSDRDSDELEREERRFEGADANFERLPSIDFAMVDSEESAPEREEALEEGSASDEETEQVDESGPFRGDEEQQTRRTERNPAVSDLDFGEEVSDGDQSGFGAVESDGSDAEEVGASRSDEDSRPESVDFEGANTEQEAEFWDSAIHERDERLDEYDSSDPAASDSADIESEWSDASEDFFDEADLFGEDEELFEESGDEGREANAGSAPSEAEPEVGEGLGGGETERFSGAEFAVGGEGSSPVLEESSDARREDAAEQSQPKYDPGESLEVESSSPMEDAPSGDRFSGESTQLGVGNSQTVADPEDRTSSASGTSSYAAPGQPDESSDRHSDPTPQAAALEGAESESTESGTGGDAADSTQPGTGEPLSDEEFFQLADELSEVSSAEDVDPIPDRFEGVGEGPSEEDRGSVDEAISEGERTGLGSDQDSSETAEFPVEDSDRLETRGPSGDTADAVRLMRQAEELVDEGKYDSAHDLVQSVLERDPESERAQQLLREIEQARASSDSLEIGSLDRVPVRELGLEQIEDTDLDHRAGFILSLVDGTLTFEDILDLSSMPRSETLEVLSKMVEKSVIRVE